MHLVIYIKKHPSNYRMRVGMVYYVRKCISCLNKVTIAILLPSTATQAPCPRCSAIVRIWS